jgi:23S rRNA pseudoU1915 N3-methylase RlmH
VTTLTSSGQTRQSGSLQKQLEDARLALDSTIQHANLADEQNLAKCEAALQRLLAAWTHLRGALKGVAEAERLSQKQQREQEEQEAARMRPAKSKLEAAVRAQRGKLLRSRHLAAQQAVNRSLGDVNEVIEGGDPAEIGDLHKQLQKQRETLMAMAVQLGDEQLNAITELQIIVDKSLRRLNRKRRELVRGANACSLFSPSPSEGRDNNGGGENVQPPRSMSPPAEEQDAITPEAGLPSNQLCQLLTTLVGGSCLKSPPPSWPKFNDSCGSYFSFKGELEAFIRD